MAALDVAIILGFIVACTAIGVRASRRGEKSGLSDYFLGERNLPAWAVTLSIVATETSAVTFLSVPGISYRGNLTFLQLAFGYILARVVIALVLMPLFFRGRIDTAYEVLENRFGGATRGAAAVLFLAARTVASSLRLFLAATVLETITGLALPVSIGVIGVSTILYTYVGGLRGVVWADVLQFFVYIAGGIAAVFVIGQLLPGGWHEVFTIARAEDKLRVFDFSPVLNRPYTFWAGVIGAMVLDMGTHGADLMMVQRYLSARSQREASGALVSSGCVILVQFALFLAIGLGVYALDQTTQSPERLPPAKDAEFATFIVERLPVGLKGLVIAAVFSVTMSTVSGALSSSASSTMNDLVKPWFPHASEARLVRSSRFVTAGWGLAQMAGALGAAGMNQAVIDAALAVAGFVSGILLGVFLLGIFDPRANQRGAFAGMVAGILAVSVAAFGTRLAYPWYALVGATTVLLVGMCGSRLITKREGA